MDRFDIALLEALQADSRRSMADLGERIGLSASACHRRIKALEEAGLTLDDLDLVENKCQVSGVGVKSRPDGK